MLQTYYLLVYNISIIGRYIKNKIKKKIFIKTRKFNMYKNLMPKESQVKCST